MLAGMPILKKSAPECFDLTSQKTCRKEQISRELSYHKEMLRDKEKNRFQLTLKMLTAITLAILCASAHAALLPSSIGLSTSLGISDLPLPTSLSLPIPANAAVTPAISVPSVSVPDLPTGITTDLPISVPSVSVPSVSIPDGVSSILSSISLPVSVPDSVTTILSGVSVPSVSIPDISTAIPTDVTSILSGLPVTVPSVSVPSASIPSISVPSLPTDVTSILSGLPVTVPSISVPAVPTA
ncbi:PPE family PPE24 [Pyrrhoderma noxium]|uniref:PPE family PPE24 n=1 Tax=Pyrrhoderma noxium TaxID=2282107 RepID=A0A286UX10_9AGAM|nr:PPE family PPE24 [Pyrrhoderma noxium]